jgi:hypothetical protein
MTGSVVRFPPRRSRAVWLIREDAVWFVLAREHGWLFGCRHQAWAEATWLASNLGLPVRVAGGAP